MKKAIVKISDYVIKECKEVADYLAEYLRENPGAAVIPYIEGLSRIDPPRPFKTPYPEPENLTTKKGNL